MYEILDKAREARSVEARSEVYVTAGGCIITSKNLSRLDWRHARGIDKWLDDEIINIMSHAFFRRAVKARKKILDRQRKASKRPIVCTSSSGGASVSSLPPPAIGGATAPAQVASSMATSASSGGATVFPPPAIGGVATANYICTLPNAYLLDLLLPLDRLLLSLA